jgi:predicted HD superfamily hydrolase involved in NAD metabolism
MPVAPTVAEAREALAARLSVPALAHCERVAETAAGLAERFGVDVEAARLAGLLHDWGRDIPAEELLRIAETRGIPVTEADRAVPYLLHGEVAAAELREVFPGLDDEITHAVACHTFGSTSMSELDRIVYIADTIEPSRDQPGVDKLRRIAAEESLDDTFVAAYARSITHIVKRRRPLHPNTVSVWNAVLAEARR